jgi:dienelactone hydrolase
MGEETLPPLKDGRVPGTFEELWSGFDPRREPLDVEVLQQWEEDGVDLKVIRYRVGVFNGKKAMMAAVYGYPKGATKVPGLVQIHGGGGAGTQAPVMANAMEGYATISIAWDGRILASQYPIDNEAKQLFWDGKKDHPKYRPTTDWGDLGAYFFPRRFQDQKILVHKLDPVESPRNSNWFVWTIAARRAITFLEQQPEVDEDRIGVYGHSMGGELTIAVAGSDSRVKAASPSCGGLTPDKPAELLLNSIYHQQITCPILFMVPTNDFHGRIHDLPSTIDRLKTEDWRVASMPHRNHSSDAEYLASVTLWFNQHLKNEFRMPDNPESKLTLKTDNGIPDFSITPDRSREVQSVAVYYTQQPATDYTERIPAMTKYWRHAPATENGGTWTAPLSVLSTNRQLWVYGDIHYANGQAVHCVKGRNIVASDTFNLSSVLKMMTPDELQAAGVKVTVKPSLVIEEFAEGWEKEWFAKGQKSRKTFKLKSPQYEAPPDSKVGIEVRSEKRGRMLIGMEWEKDSYHHAVAIEGDSAWQHVVLSPSDFRNREGEVLKDWDGLDITITPTGALEWSDLKLRNLKWTESDQLGERR